MSDLQKHCNRYRYKYPNENFVSSKKCTKTAIKLQYLQLSCNALSPYVLHELNKIKIKYNSKMALIASLIIGATFTMLYCRKAAKIPMGPAYFLGFNSLLIITISARNKTAIFAIKLNKIMHIQDIE